MFSLYAFVRFQCIPMYIITVFLCTFSMYSYVGMYVIISLRMLSLYAYLGMYVIVPQCMSQYVFLCMPMFALYAYVC